MAGTKMTLRRTGEEIIYWFEQEIIVDQNFIDTHGLTIPLEHAYILDSKMLEVYLNGQRLSDGGGYEEIDEHTIRLDLGLDSQGRPVPLHVGDELYIRTWKQEFAQSGGSVDAARFEKLEAEVAKARTFRDGDQSYNNLDDRLDAIQEKVTTRIPVFVLAKVKLGASISLPIPFSGKVSHVVVRLDTPAAEDISIRVERNLAANVENPVWDNMVTRNIVIEAGKRTIEDQPVFSIQTINTDDELRLFVEQAPAGTEKLIIQVVIIV